MHVRESTPVTPVPPGNSPAVISHSQYDDDNDDESNIGIDNFNTHLGILMGFHLYSNRRDVGPEFDLNVLWTCIYPGHRNSLYIRAPPSSTCPPIWEWTDQRRIFTLLKHLSRRVDEVIYRISERADSRGFFGDSDARRRFISLAVRARVLIELCARPVNLFISVIPCTRDPAVIDGNKKTFYLIFGR